MAALSADIQMDHREDTLQRTEIVSYVTDVYYKGALAFYSAAGEGITPVCASGTLFAGVVECQVSATAGVTKVKLVNGVFKFPKAGASAQASQAVGFYADVSGGSDNPADTIVTSPATGDNVVGVGVQYADSTHTWVDTRVRSIPTVAA